MARTSSWSGPRPSFQTNSSIMQEQCALKLVCLISSWRSKGLLRLLLSILLLLRRSSSNYRRDNITSLINKPSTHPSTEAGFLFWTSLLGLSHLSCLVDCFHPPSWQVGANQTSKIHFALHNLTTRVGWVGQRKMTTPPHLSQNGRW